ncbi:asparagine synthase (glutamine-hydrolyzing) [Mesorhizobium sp. M6A.T.Ce.TU.016.01.1.1]|uniref:asparagine synthase (glutamine-hydrolyzing) n=1 Tax=Mesorhizobium sp. M6A.T.Ce.TU.016.01.1.1 TaxID=2496783 RepID=UPI000FCB2344|nr:asparagine synthase (glutamine-hydrolyzing) [Mesorhizobium sp. M6A.T.Ce.TU.016.01.1.1]RUU32556.1 asparagine synthase (glutamine-hydrolyzing) [Mesorhizobium sp. M6A.T.Ce.TU.016.01.1.1]
MCGIFALQSEQGVSRESLVNGVRALRHRGPDGSGTWIAPHGRVGLGHARLSIMDPLGGAQPLSSDDDLVHAVVAGEFYDYERLRRQMIELGYRLRSRSDSELLVHLYKERGVDCLAELRGEFTFVLWDERTGVLFAARDRFGVKPLYYARSADTLFLGSECKALFAAGIVARWDGDSVFQELNGVLTADRSLFTGVAQLPPGHYLLSDGERVKVIQYWDLHYPRLNEGLPSRPDEEWVELMRAELREAVELRLRADVPVACYLSGGVDSGAILGMASSLSANPIDAFTIGFDAGPLDESAVAVEMAAHAGARLNTMHVTETDLAQHWEDTIVQCEVPAFNANCAAKYLLSRHVRDAGHKVVLTGEGADEMLGGYAVFRSDLLANDEAVSPAVRRQRLAALREQNRHFGWEGRAPAGPMASVDGVRRKLGFVPEFIEQFAVRAAIIRSLLDPDYRSSFDDRDPYEVLLGGVDVAGGMEGRSALHQSMYLWTKTVLPNRQLTYLGDRVEMAHSVEARTPFLDHKLAEAVARMPVAMKINGMTEKHVLREAARPYLPAAVYGRRKHPFLAPAEAGGALFRLAEERLTDPTFASMPFYDTSAMHALLNRARQSPGDVWLLPVLLLISSTAVLHRRYCL